MQNLTAIENKGQTLGFYSIEYGERAGKETAAVRIFDGNRTELRDFKPEKMNSETEITQYLYYKNGLSLETVSPFVESSNCAFWRTLIS